MAERESVSKARGTARSRPAVGRLRHHLNGLGGGRIITTIASDTSGLRGAMVIRQYRQRMGRHMDDLARFK